MLQDPDTTSSASISLGGTANGHFEISGVPPGIYDLYASVPDIQGYGPAAPPGRAVQPVAYGRTTIDVHGGDRDGINVVVHHGVDITGRVTIDGGTSPSVNNVRVSLQVDDSAAGIPVYQQVGRFPLNIAPDGAFTIPAVPEAQYRFQITTGAPPPLPTTTILNSLLTTGVATGPRGGAVIAAGAPVAGVTAPTAPPTTPPATPPLPQGTYLADVRQGGLSVFDDGIFVGAQVVAPVEVIVKTNGGIIDGIVRDAKQMPAAGALVALVPQEQHRQNPGLYKSATSDASGRFSMTAIPPGDYKLFAWDNIAPGAYQNSAFLNNYEDRGVSVRVAPAIHLDTQVSLIVIKH
jgi:hypothetical protein